MKSMRKLQRRGVDVAAREAMSHETTVQDLARIAVNVAVIVATVAVGAVGVVDVDVMIVATIGVKSPVRSRIIAAAANRATIAARVMIGVNQFVATSLGVKSRVGPKCAETNRVAKKVVRRVDRDSMMMPSGANPRRRDHRPRAMTRLMRHAIHSPRPKHSKCRVKLAKTSRLATTRPGPSRWAMKPVNKAKEGAASVAVVADVAVAAAKVHQWKTARRVMA
jgi:uncharacterized membrane protein YuzA (DUF378 family)